MAQPINAKFASRLRMNPSWGDVPPEPAAVTQAPNPQSEPPDPPVAHDLEACANVVLNMLPKHIAEYAREMAYVYNRQPVWALVAGHVLKAYENGDIQAPMLDPSWPRAWKDLPMDPSTAVATCEWKGGEKGEHTFVRRRYKQRYCSNECGVAAAMAPKVEA